MRELNKLLVVIEPDQREQPALVKAAILAKFVDCELELILADYNAFLDDGNFYDPIQAKQMRYEHADERIAELELLAQPLRHEGLSVSVLTSWGNPPYKEIVARAKDSGVSLVIKATARHNQLSRKFLSNEDWELVRYCPTPLLLVKNQDWSSKPVFVASLDPKHVRDKPAELDNDILSAAQALSEITQGSTHLYHSNWKPSMAMLPPTVTDRETNKNVLEGLAAKNGIPSKNCHCCNRQITESLPALVSALSASVVVMGAISRSLLDRILIGNTAEKVLDELECDVLVIKPKAAMSLAMTLL